MGQPDYYAANEISKLEDRISDLEDQVMGLQSPPEDDEPKKSPAKEKVDKRVAKIENTLQQLRGDDGIRVALPVIALTAPRRAGDGLPAGYGPVPLQTCLNGLAAQMNVIGTEPETIPAPPGA